MCFDCDNPSAGFGVGGGGGRQVSSERFLFWRVWRPALFRRGLVWRLPLGPQYASRSVFERDTGWRSAFLCSDMPLGNSREWRTIYFKGVWFLPLLGGKIQLIAFLYLSKVDSPKVTSYCLSLRTLLWGRIYLRKALAYSEPLAGQWCVGALDSYTWHMSEGLCPSIQEWHLPLAAVNAKLPDGPWEEAVLWRSRGSCLLGLA